MRTEVLHHVVESRHDTQVTGEGAVGTRVIQLLVHNEGFGEMRHEPDVEDVIAVLREHATRPPLDGPVGGIMMY